MNNISSVQVQRPTASISLRKFRENTEAVVKSLKKGASVTVYKRSKPFFTISAPVVDEWGDEGEWTNLIDFREAGYSDGIPAGELLQRMRKFEQEELAKNGR